MQAMTDWLAHTLAHMLAQRQPDACCLNRGYGVFFCASDIRCHAAPRPPDAEIATLPQR